MHYLPLLPLLLLLLPFLLFFKALKAIAWMLSRLGETALYWWDHRPPSPGKLLNHRYRRHPGSRLRADRHLKCGGCGKQTTLVERLLSFSLPECFECRRRRTSTWATRRH